MGKRKPPSRLAFRIGRKRKRGRPRVLKLKLKRSERKKLDELMRRGQTSVRILKRAQVLKLLDSRRTTEEAAEAIGFTPLGVRKIIKRYQKGGLGLAIEEPSRPGHEPAIKEREGPHLIAMVCGPAPEGRARWTVRLVAEEANRRGVTNAKKEAIRLFMQKHSLKPWREKNVVYSGADPGICKEDGGCP